MTKKVLSDWQRQVLVDLDAAIAAYPDDLALLGQYKFNEQGAMLLKIRVRTADIAMTEGGLRLDEHEEFTIVVNESALVPPKVVVDHLRFLHHAHVLQGTRPCLYLDPSREWDPIRGFGGFLDRLLEWLSDAAAGKFDAQLALYHAVGGVLHANREGPTIVVRSPIDSSKRAQHGWLVTRTDHRIDLTLDRSAAPDDAEHVPVIALRTDLPLGAGLTLARFLFTVANPYSGHPRPGGDLTGATNDEDSAAMVLTAIAASAIRKPVGSDQRFVIAVPHPTGGPPHLLAGHIPAAGADHLRDLVKKNRARSSAIDIDPKTVGATQPLEWVPVSDERKEVTTRRDSTRPVTAFADKTVHIWGCGGIGSWVAEYLVRAGVKKIVLCDPGTISGGLLVRQNFVENDIGKYKVDALAERLHGISDSVVVEHYDSMTPAPADLVGVDLIVDATVSVAIGRVLDAIATAVTPEARPVLAHMATDAKSGTLGILTVSMAPLNRGPIVVDRAVGAQIVSEGIHEAFHGLWGDPSASEEIVPTRGCSTPTFHGSAADLAAVAASLTSILGTHLSTGAAASGSHLISMPHGEAGPLRTFVPAPEVDETATAAAATEPQEPAEGAA